VHFILAVQTGRSSASTKGVRVKYQRVDLGI
jgi:hypothetical protein